MASSVDFPVRTLPDPNWEHLTLYTRVREAIYVLPFYFKTETVIAGVMATDIFTLNATLGATIEEQVVSTLNAMRSIWDPEDRYKLYGFVRQAQTFPDVLLRRLTPSEADEAIILGIELKGWYLLAKEGEPSFRFQVTPAACSPHDLLVVVPWALSSVISGSPRVFTPFVESARYAADYRNYHWQHLRETTSDTRIASPAGVAPYPRKADKIADKPASDSGGNFGRFARTGLMDEYLEAARSQALAGIQAKHWLSFFKAFQEQKTADVIEAELSRLIEHLSKTETGIDAITIQRVRNIADELRNLVLGDNGS
ncbi:MAG TPA: hypothetical protein VJG32_16820 [Anaerolineae bacterium]|nr:hypothetical protein [Anaerolineae bacterium]